MYFYNSFDLNNTLLIANIGQVGERAQHRAPDLSGAVGKKFKEENFITMLPMG
jgi:hypothetical protein